MKFFIALILLLAGTNTADAKPYSYSDYTNLDNEDSVDIVIPAFENTNDLPKVEKTEDYIFSDKIEESKEIELPKEPNISEHFIKDFEPKKNSFNGNINGIVKKHRGSGHIEEINYENGKRNGVSRTYDKNGNLVMEWEFKNDLRHGWNKSYYANGQLKMERLFQNDRLNGISKHYSPKGQLEEEINYKSITPEGPVRDGPYKRYYINGTLQFDVNYKNDILDGPYKEYHPNGKLKVEGVYENGVPNGLFKFYHLNGKLKKEIKYKNGKRDKLHLLFKILTS